MAKIDLKKQLRAFYNPPASAVAVVEVPPLSFAMVDGAGDPNTSAAYAAAIQALYTLSYTLKFHLKKGPQAIDYTVMPLEGLWWADEGIPFRMDDKASWQWTAMILQPDQVTPELFNQARQEVEKKKRLTLPPSLRLERFQEGAAVQIMHIGPYAAEAPTIAQLHAYIAQQGWRPWGKHHEIYLTDPNRTAPEKTRTVIRSRLLRRSRRLNLLTVLVIACRGAIDRPGPGRRTGRPRRRRADARRGGPINRAPTAPDHSIQSLYFIRGEERG